MYGSERSQTLSHPVCRSHSAYESTEHRDVGPIHGCDRSQQPLEEVLRGTGEYLDTRSAHEEDDGQQQRDREGE